MNFQTAFTPEKLQEAWEIVLRDFPQATWDTLYVTIISTFFAIVLGLPLGMMLAGMQLADVDLRGLLRDWTLPAALVIKNLVDPLLILLLLSALHFPPLLIQLGVIFSAVPAPAMLVVYAANYKVQPGYAGAFMFLSTLCGAVTLPFWSFVVTAFLPLL